MAQETYGSILFAEAEDSGYKDWQLGAAQPADDALLESPLGLGQFSRGKDSP
jgi:hypothetical protein